MKAKPQKIGLWHWLKDRWTYAGESGRWIALGEDAAGNKLAPVGTGLTKHRAIRDWERKVLVSEPPHPESIFPMPELEPPPGDPSWAVIGGLVAGAFVVAIVVILVAL